MGARTKTTGSVLKPGAFAKEMDTAVEDVVRVAGDRALQLVHQRLGSVLQHPTGYYKSRVTVSNAQDSMELTDGGVVYGPWLEGTSSRNSSTRFKGYHTFRLVEQQMEKEALDIGEASVTQAIGRLS